MQKTKLLIKSLSKNTTKTTQNWRAQVNHTHLVSQISSIVVQRRNWPSILQTLNLKSKLTPSIFLQILNSTQIPPQISLNFFKWAIKNTSFRPDVFVQCRLTHLLIGSGLVNPSKPILNSLLENGPPVLNGACRYNNDEMIKFAMEFMAEKGYISKHLTKHDSVIQKLCDIRKTHAAYMLFKIACDAQICLEHKTYGCMIQALSMDTRLKEAIEIYRVIEHKQLKVNPIFYNEFITVLCNENASKEVNLLLTDLISKGYKPTITSLSNYITSQCKKQKWKEAEELAELALQESIFLESSCCGLLIKHYCKSAQIDLAMNLYNQMVEKDYCVDSTACSSLITGLLEVLKVEEAEKVFDYMRIKNLLTSESFVIMINGFCRENELKKAMKLHDEMIEMGLKPSLKMYKRLICNFK